MNLPAQTEVGPVALTRPVTAQQAASLLGREVGTIYSWVTRYRARRVGLAAGRRLYDFDDLAVIEREIGHGHPVPATWQLRRDISGGCSL